MLSSISPSNLISANTTPPHHNKDTRTSFLPPPLPTSYLRSSASFVGERFLPSGCTHQSRKGGSAAAASSRGSHFIWVVKAPLRVLCRARDLYVSSMTGCASRFSYSGAVGYPAGAPALGVPCSNSFQGWSSGSSSSSGEDDLRELIRVASRGATGSLNLGTSPGKGPVGARSRSLGMGRIDEDKPCDFGEVSMAPMLYPRSRSCAVPKRKVGVKA